MNYIFHKNNEQWNGSSRFIPLLRFLIPITLLLLAALFSPFFSALTIESGVGDYCLPLKNGEEFSIKYTHSVNRSPVIDTIERTDNTLTIRSSLYQTYGAGIPVLSDNVGDVYTETEDGYLLSGIDAVYPEISVITGTYSDHRLIYRNQELALKDSFGEKTPITLSIRRVSLIQLILYRL